LSDQNNPDILADVSEVLECLLNFGDGRVCGQVTSSPDLTIRKFSVFAVLWPTPASKNPVTVSYELNVPKRPRRQSLQQSCSLILNAGPIVISEQPFVKSEYVLDSVPVPGVPENIPPCACHTRSGQAAKSDMADGIRAFSKWGKTRGGAG
jgi:hypothetical protein